MLYMHVEMIRLSVKSRKSIECREEGRQESIILYVNYMIYIYEGM